MNTNTRDLTEFGYRELDMAGDLLKAYAKGGSDFLYSGVTVEFNPNSGMVFLVDEDYNVGIFVDGQVVQFYSCPVCGYEATQAEAIEDGKDFEEYNGYCSKACEDENEGK